MSKASRDKGQRGERECFALLSDELGFVVKRNVDQARLGGADCIELPGFAPEVKRREMLAKPTWWKQAVRQGAEMQREPIVFYRRNRQPWRALITGPYGYRDVEWAEAMDYIRDKLARLYGIYPKMKEAA